MMSVILIAGAMTSACQPGSDGPFPIAVEISVPYSSEQNPSKSIGRYFPRLLETCFRYGSSDNCKEVVVEDPDTLKKLELFLFEGSGDSLVWSQYFEKNFNWQEYKLAAVYPSAGAYRLARGSTVVTKITKQVEYADRLEIEYIIRDRTNDGWTVYPLIPVVPPSLPEYGSALVIPRTCKPVVFKPTIENLIEWR